jgi:hypothetical protein
MSSLSCRFCSHGNPEGAKFCNQCGSPLNLVPCARCEAINNVADEHCTTCGAPMLAGAEVAETALVEPVLAMASEGAHRAESGGAVPVALADRLEHDVGEGAATSQAPRRPVPQPVPSRDFTFTPAPPDEAPRTRRIRPYSETWYPARVRGMLLGLVFVAIVGAVTWTSIDPTRFGLGRSKPDVPAGSPSARTAVQAEPPQPAAASVAAPATPPTTPPSSADTVAPASSNSVAPASSNAVTPASSDSVTPPSSEAAMPAAADAATPASSADAPAAANAPAGESDAATPASAAAPAATRAPRAPRSGPAARENRVAKRDARPPVETPARAAADNRTREQAERDAIATQRLIARELGNAPSSAPPPAAR